MKSIKLNKRKTYIQIVNILILIVLLIIYFSNYKGYPDENWSKKVSIVAIILLIIQIVEMKYLSIRNERLYVLVCNIAIPILLWKNFCTCIRIRKDVIMEFV